jgi:hypothetical protein
MVTPKQVRQAFSAGLKSGITLVLDTCSVSVLDQLISDIDTLPERIRQCNERFGHGSPDAVTGA